MQSQNLSRAYLPKLAQPPATILDHLDARFPHVGRDVWIARLERRVVRATTGEIITPATEYTSGLTLTYYREVVDEPDVPFAETIVLRNEHLVIADKPHFLPVTPTGPYVTQCLVARLRLATGLDDLVPIHRLDLETAGLVLFVARPEHRHLYHRLFAEDAIEKEYLAVATLSETPTQRTWLVERQMIPGEPWFRMKIGPGQPNSSTLVELIEQRDGRGLFRLTPRTGKKHQLRVHMASLGFPIINDQLYPDAPPAPCWDHTRPLQLLARRLAFLDPLTGQRVEAESQRVLETDWRSA